MNYEIDTLNKEIEIYDKTAQLFNDEERLLFRYITTRYTNTPKEVARIIAKEVVRLAKENELKIELLTGIIEVESNFNPYSLSKSGAVGLMQIMPEIWTGELQLNGKKDLWSIGINIESGVKILKHYLNKNEGNLNKALCDYNGGDKSYSDNVYTAVGRIVIFKNMIRYNNGGSDVKNQ